MKMAFIGDSLVSCPNVSMKEGWYDQVSKTLGMDYCNNAAGGKMTLVMWGMFKMDVVDEKADGVFLCCGINDILLDEPLEKVKENIAGTLDKAQAAGLSPIIVGKPPLTRPESADHGWQVPSEVAKHNADLEEYRAWLDAEARKRGLPLFDYEKVLQDAEKAAGKSLLQDGLHPTAEGYQAIAKAFLAQFGAQLKEQA